MFKAYCGRSRRVSVHSAKAVNDLAEPPLQRFIHNLSLHSWSELHRLKRDAELRGQCLRINQSSGTKLSNEFSWHQKVGGKSVRFCFHGAAETTPTIFVRRMPQPGSIIVLCTNAHCRALLEAVHFYFIEL